MQSLLKSKHKTWVRVPRELWPEEWHKQGYQKLMCLLKKALYGHPESGAHWEAHLHKAVLTIGGRPVPNHPSSYWFPNEKLLLTVYVDDLMLSGPIAAHHDFWGQLAQHIFIEPYENLERFLSRTMREVLPYRASPLHPCTLRYSGAPT